MLVTLTGAPICVIGNIKGWTKRKVTDTVQAAGGSVTGTAREGGVVLLGSRPSGPKLTQARSRKCVIVEGEDVLTLLDAGSVELEEAPGRSLDELVGEARELLDGAPGRTTFDAITSLLDDCEPGHLEDLSTYLEPQLSSWRTAQDDPKNSWYERRNMDARGLTGLCADAAGALRRMPIEWVAELLRDGPSPKHRVCDALSFSGVQVSNTVAAKIFENPTLDFLRVFSLGETNEASNKNKTFFKKMLASDALANVESFVVHECNPGGLASLMGHPECLPSLNALHLSRTTRYMASQGDTTRAGAALAQTWGHQLEVFGVALKEHVAWLAEHRGSLTALEQVVICDSPWDENAHDYKETCKHLPDALQGVGHVTFGCKHFTALEAFIVALGRNPPDGLRVLDLSPSTYDSICAEEPSILLGRAICDFKLRDQLERVVLNDTFHPSLSDKLTTKGLEVEIVALR